MKPPIPFQLITAVGLIAWLSPRADAATYAVTNGIYDPGAAESNQANAVDTDATGTLAAFKASLLTAYSANLGGVAHFDAVQGTGDSILNFTYGSGKTLRVTSSNTHSVAGMSSATTSILGISGASGALGTAGVGVLNTTAGSNVTFTIGAITNGGASEGVTSFGFTILSRNTYGTSGYDFNAIAYFSDGTNSGTVSSNIGSTIQTDDTFWSFTAPAGYSITSIAITTTSGSSSPVFDDIGFTTALNVIVPEPSAAILSEAGLVLIALRRRRRS